MKSGLHEVRLSLRLRFMRRLKLELRLKLRLRLGVAVHTWVLYILHRLIRHDDYANIDISRSSIMHIIVNVS